MPEVEDPDPAAHLAGSAVAAWALADELAAEGHTAEAERLRARSRKYREGFEAAVSKSQS